MDAKLFVLAIGDARQDRQRWSTLIGDSYRPVANTADLNDIFHQLFSTLMGLVVLPGQNLPSDLSVQVEPILEHLSFSFVRSTPAITITLTDPSGNVITPTTQSVDKVYHQIYSIVNPVGGSWQIQRQGTGSVEYWIDRRYATVSVDMKAQYPYSGQSITVTARLMRSGTIITNTPSLSVEVQLVAPDHQVKTLSLNPADTGGIYTGIFTDTQVSGAYIASARVHLTDGQLLSTRQLSTTIVLLPAPPLPTAIPSPTIAETATMTPTGTSGGGGSNSGTPWLLQFLTGSGLTVALLGITVGATATWRFKRAQEKARGLQQERDGLISTVEEIRQEQQHAEQQIKDLEQERDGLTSTVEEIRQKQQHAEQQIKDRQQEIDALTNTLNTPHLEVEAERAAQQLNEKVDQARLTEDLNEASTICFDILTSAVSAENMIEEEFSKPINDALELLEGKADELLAPDGKVLQLDKIKGWVLKIGISQQRQENGTLIRSVIEYLNRMLHKSPTDESQSRKVTVENLKCIAEHRIQLLHPLQKSDHSKINLPAVRAFGGIAERLYKLLNEDDPDKQGILLRKVAQWFREAHIWYTDIPEWKQQELAVQARRDTVSDQLQVQTEQPEIPDEASYYEYLANLSEHPFRPVERPTLPKDFWRNLQMNSNLDLNLEQEFRKTFRPVSHLKENKDEVIGQIDTFQTIDITGNNVVYSRQKEQGILKGAMMILRYEEVVKNPERFLAFTGHTQ